MGKVIQQATSPALQSTNLLALLGQHIATRPSEIKNLLKRYQVSISKNSDGQALMNHLFLAIETQGKSFHHALAQLLHKKWEPKEDAFNMGALLGKGGAAAASAAPAQNSGITVGSDPVSAIAGAIGSVANIFGNHQNRKTLKMQARSKTLQSMMNYKTQKEQQVASKAASVNAQLTQEKTIKMAGIAAAIGILGWLMIRQTRKNTPLSNPK